MCVGLQNKSLKNQKIFFKLFNKNTKKSHQHYIHIFNKFKLFIFVLVCFICEYLKPYLYCRIEVFFISSKIRSLKFLQRSICYLLSNSSNSSNTKSIIIKL